MVGGAAAGLGGGAVRSNLAMSDFMLLFGGNRLSSSFDDGGTAAETGKDAVCSIAEFVGLALLSGCPSVGFAKSKSVSIEGVEATTTSELCTNGEFAGLVLLLGDS